MASAYFPDPPDRQRFVRADTDEAAQRLAAILREENVDVLLSYDPNGGFGHRDHVKVHEVGKRAAELAGVGTVLEATMPRDVIERLVRLIRALRIPFGYDPTHCTPPAAPVRPSLTESTCDDSPDRSRQP